MLRVLQLFVVTIAAALVVPPVVQGLVGNRPAEVEDRSPSTRTRADPAVVPARPTGGTVVLKAAENGHFYTATRINGRPVDIMVDTGASVVALTYEDARRVGIRPARSEFRSPMRTANGTAYAARVTLREVRIGSIRLGDVRGVVMPRGKLGVSLLGMSFLNRLSRADVRSGTLILAP